MDKGKAEEDPVLDNADGDGEGDGRRSREINIDMLVDRRDSFEVARIGSPEVGLLKYVHLTSKVYLSSLLGCATNTQHCSCQIHQYG